MSEVTGKALEDLKAFGEIMDMLATLYEPAESQQWMVSPQPVLDGAKPIDLIRTGRTQEVLDVVQAIDSGTYL